VCPHELPDFRQSVEDAKGTPVKTGAPRTPEENFALLKEDVDALVA
jgi:hypothetical protein